ncbi:MAG: NADH-quinone oxidoreductase subunit N [Proteobacteria bacterium]|nr:NADH-quinone oxidoreductase subunit N [Pseudomonadota bacterium]MCL2307685.1 NADH-quinone oxidoreductase subunit N [Pseudomonadota bacterium]
MTFSLIPLLPELTLLAALALILLMVSLYPSQDGTAAYGVTQLALWVALLALWLTQDFQNPQSVMGGMLLRNATTLLMQSAALLSLSLALLYGRASLIRQKLWKPETFMLFLCSTLGVLAVIGAYHFVPLFVGLELMALPLYAMVALRKDDALSIEAGLKYFFLGALASGFMLYGISLVYGATGSLGLFAIAQVASGFSSSNTLLLLGLIFIVAGLAFKLSVVPFHMWAPDVYRGAPTVVALFVSTVPKLAAVVLLLRLMSGPLQSLMTEWQAILALLAVLSMIVGAVVAIAQPNLKRMLAYSTIGHMGYLLLGALVGTQGGFSSALFYMLTYVLSNLVAFGVLLSMNEMSDGDDKNANSENASGENANGKIALSRGSDLEDFRGLYQRSPLRAVLMTLAMLSLAGVPPLLGFYGKFAVIGVALMNGFVWLSIIAILTSVIAAFYYLRVVRLMLFSNQGEGEVEALPAIGVIPRAVLAFNGFALLMLGLFPSVLLDTTARALAWAGLI